jgi:hypothetical protein
VPWLQRRDAAIAHIKCTAWGRSGAARDATKRLTPAHRGLSMRITPGRPSSLRAWSRPAAARMVVQGGPRAATRPTRGPRQPPSYDFSTRRRGRWSPG